MRLLYLLKLQVLFKDEAERMKRWYLSCVLAVKDKKSSEKLLVEKSPLY